MTRALLRRRTRSRGSKGISSIIGAIALVIVGLLISTNVFLWALQQNTLYGQKVAESHQSDQDRFSEEMSVSTVSTSIVNNEMQVNASLINRGPVAVQILTLWVVDSTIDAYNYTDEFSSGSRLNYNPGDWGQIRAIVKIDGGIEELHDFDLWLMTGRGNLVSLIPDLDPPPVKNFGVFSMDWFFWKYSSTQTSGEMDDGGIIDIDDDYVAFYVRLTNNYEENVAIMDRSFIEFIVPWIEPLFYIVEAVDYNGGTPQITPYDNDNPIVVAPHETAILTFAADMYGENSWTWRTNGRSLFNEDHDDIGAVAMPGLIYTFESDPTNAHGQSIPYQSFIVSVTEWNPGWWG